MNFREFSGKSLEEAIDSACAYFNTNASYIEYEVIKKSKNTVNYGEKILSIKARPKVKNIEEKKIEKKKPKIDIDIDIEKKVTLKEDLSDDAKKIVELLDNLMKKTCYDYRLDVLESSEDIKIRIYGPEMKTLIQEDGVGIDSINHIVGRMLNKNKFQNKRVNIDINDFRLEKESYIKKLAQRLAEKSRKTNSDVLVNPMNAYDRRIFHLEVEKIEGVNTKSLGDGYLKKIKVFPS